MPVKVDWKGAMCKCREMCKCLEETNNISYRVIKDGPFEGLEIDAIRRISEPGPKP